MWGACGLSELSWEGGEGSHGKGHAWTEEGLTPLDPDSWDFAPYLEG